MKRLTILVAVLIALLAFTSCSKKEEQSAEQTAPQTTEQRHATVIMTDGSKTSGAVVKSSDAEITIVGDDGITRTIPMAQVRSVEYGEAAAEPAKAEQQAAAPAPQAQPAPAKRVDRSVRQQSAAPTPAPAPRPVVRKLELAAGADIPVRTDELIDSGKASEGQTFSGEVTKDIVNDEGQVVIPARSSAEIVIVSAEGGGRIKGKSDLVLDLAAVSVNGRRYAVETSPIAERGKDGLGANKRTAKFTGGGAAIGAIIGAVAGGGKGAAIGAGAGAGAGALGQIITKGGSIKVPAETILSFRLEDTLVVTAR